MIKSRKVKWAGHVVCIEDTITEYKILFRKAEGKKLLGRHTVYTEVLYYNVC